MSEEQFSAANEVVSISTPSTSVHQKKMLCHFSNPFLAVQQRARKTRKGKVFH
jgi:hypothetical protein